MLSRCNEMIVTGGSSFGFIAAMRAKRLPYHFDYKENMTECKRATLSHPPSRLHESASF